LSEALGKLKRSTRPAGVRRAAWRLENNEGKDERKVRERDRKGRKERGGEEK